MGCILFQGFYDGRMRGMIPSLHFMAIHSKPQLHHLCDNQIAHAIKEFGSVNMDA